MNIHLQFANPIRAVLLSALITLITSGVRCQEVCLFTADQSMNVYELLHANYRMYQSTHKTNTGYADFYFYQPDQKPDKNLVRSAPDSLYRILRNSKATCQKNYFSLKSLKGKRYAAIYYENLNLIDITKFGRNDFPKEMARVTEDSSLFVEEYDRYGDPKLSYQIGYSKYENVAYSINFINTPPQDQHPTRMIFKADSLFWKYFLNIPRESPQVICDEFVGINESCEFFVPLTKNQGVASVYKTIQLPEGGESSPFYCKCKQSDALIGLEYPNIMDALKIAKRVYAKTNFQTLAEDYGIHYMTGDFQYSDYESYSKDSSWYQFSEAILKENKPRSTYDSLLVNAIFFQLQHENKRSVFPERMNREINRLERNKLNDAYAALAWYREEPRYFLYNGYYYLSSGNNLRENKLLLQSYPGGTLILSKSKSKKNLPFEEGLIELYDVSKQAELKEHLLNKYLGKKRRAIYNFKHIDYLVFIPE